MCMFSIRREQDPALSDGHGPRRYTSGPDALPAAARSGRSTHYQGDGRMAGGEATLVTLVPRHLPPPPRHLQSGGV
ncbi:hypothetical protein E2C01_056836 [Portunus trituberculatus]|uniref:Uncharacterized protein n=1 Tax=Portunus trituberculatus TaxID=210409 RepID=A0A5B7GYS3_PORTR|nr:hypothetical protein [Portunus trituberculatus]